MKSLLLLLVILGGLTAGCSTFKPVKDTAAKYLLEATVPARTPTSSTPALAIAQPSLPVYLDRQQFVTRGGDGQLQFHELYLWSEPLSDGVARVIAENLRHLTGSTTIQPVRDFVSLDYTALVEIQVAQFDPDPSGAIVLRCTWKVQSVDGTPATFRAFRTEVPVTATPAVSGRVAAMNEALARLSRTIAASL